MKILKIHDYVSERMKINPITRAELDNAKENVKLNPFNVTEKDLIGELEGFPLGVVVRMLEEQRLQGNEPNVKVLQKYKTASKDGGGFDWDKTKRGPNFWSEVIGNCNFDNFYESYPEYKRYDKTK